MPLAPTVEIATSVLMVPLGTPELAELMVASIVWLCKPATVVVVPKFPPVASSALRPTARFDVTRLPSGFEAT